MGGRICGLMRKERERRMETIYDVPVLLRREIEARMIQPFLEAFEKELGREKTMEIAEKVIAESARKQGEEYAKLLNGNDMDALRRQEKGWSAGGALKMESNTEGEDTLKETVKCCAYVEMYERIGMKDLGYTLSCMRDEHFYKGFNPDMTMTRTKTLMTGGDCCDFCFKFPKKD